jgi:Domain of unknown function (DUF4270)
MNINFLKTLVTVFAVASLVSCDKDFLTIGGDIIGNKNFDIITEEITDGVTVYDIGITNSLGEGIQAENLPTNQLGVFKNGVFGVTKANVVTQLSLATINPTINSGVEVDSVVLTVPYFSSKTATLSSGKGKYKLNEIYTDNSNDTIYNPIDLKVFRNNYNLSDFDTQDPSKAAKYYSNRDSDFSNNIASGQLNDTIDVLQNTSFKPLNKEFVRYKVDATTLKMLPRTSTNIESRLAPRMRLKLNKNYFKTAILDASDKLVNNEVFKNYFRGLYFQVEGFNGTLMNLDFSKGDVTIYYKQHKFNNKPLDGFEMKSLVLNMTSNTVNLLNNSDDNVYKSNVNSYNRTKENKIYLKGGQGSIAFVELDAAKLDVYKNSNYLINDAFLEFTVDFSTSGIKESYLPQRLYLYDLDNNRSLLDYSFDNSEDAEGNAKKNKFIHGGILYKDNGLNKYKIRITEQLNRYLRDKSGDVKNVRLGLAITDNIGYVTETLFGRANRSLFKSIDAPLSVSGTEKLNSFPIGSILSPLGVALFGNTNDTNRVKFIISYTKPN